ncbi:hypothetical protein GCM10010348_62260 [Streptomyces anthocyanicus]|uniref:hypothetical protein n=1 Tax=Streptomyces anthocyanicus TaxID=68174 RepID=UPI0018751B6C|nr:hypothetical protein [Streptomyces anthocyanicus]GHC27706.1 hypothetical protein GCM10010348_62260 [Streptomyces anthocyanicus]
MSTDFDSFSNRGEYLSAHYFAEQLGQDLKKGLLATWTVRESDEKDPRPTPREMLRALRGTYLSEEYRNFFAERAKLDAEDDADENSAAAGARLNTYDDGDWRERLSAWHDKVLAALGFAGAPERRQLTVHRAGREHTVATAWHGDGIVALECGWAAGNDTALDADGPGRLQHPLRVSGSEVYESGQSLATWLFQSELGEPGGEPPRFVLLLCGGVIVLADRQVWGEGRFLAANLDAALERNDRKQGGELATIAALFSRELLAPAEDGKGPGIDALVKASRDNAVGVSGELREGLQRSVEIIANEVLARLKQAGIEPRRIEDPKLPFAKELTRESLRYLYRILFLLYAEARPELGILPADDGTYEAGYSVARLRELVERDEQLVEEEARNGHHLFASLDVLFNKVNRGHRPYGTEPDDDLPDDDEETRKLKAKRRSEDRGLRFEPLRSELFEPKSIRLIGRGVLDPRSDEDTDPKWLDLRLRNHALHEVLRLLTMKKARRRGERGGFISYRNLGINQLGAVYEGLMSYTGIIAEEELCEVAKGGDPEKGSWLVPAHRRKEYPEKTWVEYDEHDAVKGLRGPKKYEVGEFVYRLAGRDRETSASYYTPESLTKVTVELALKHLLDQERDENGEVVRTRASELLTYKICEPALGSGAFLNEAINQVAEEYLRRRQDELGVSLPASSALTEKQKVKAYVALHNAYGVDLNATGVELAEVSLWLNTMHPGMRAPWFGLHLRRGNSLIGGRRAVYTGEDVVSPSKAWLAAKNTLAPTPLPFLKDGEPQQLPVDAVHQFLLPSPGWAAVTGSKEAKELAKDEVARLAAWKKGILQRPKRSTAHLNKDGTPKLDKAGRPRREAPSQFTRLRDAAKRAEFLWSLVIKRMRLSEAAIARKIDVWGAEPGDPEYDFLRTAAGAVPKEQVMADLFLATETPYWRLKKVMDAWCALWFWPADKASLLDGTDGAYDATVPAVASADALGGLLGVPLIGGGTTGLGEGSEGSTTTVPEPRFTEQTMLFASGPTQETLVSATAENEPLIALQAVEASGQSRRGAPKQSKQRTWRDTIPLVELDDWLDFLEALLGTVDPDEQNLVTEFDNLDALKDFEKNLPHLMGMDLADPETRFPWMHTVTNITEEQGFLHWELDFALVFAQGGGFDLQVGNPPWVRPRWNESSVLAEHEPWFELTERASTAKKEEERAKLLRLPKARQYVLNELTNVSGQVAVFGASQVYPLLTGTQPDLYRAFMSQVWAHASASGTTGLVHPDTHFTGDKEGALREAAYRRLRVHGDFVNGGQRFFPPPVGHTAHFGVHVYGQRQEIGFDHLSWLVSTDALRFSAEHDGSGEVPGVRYRNGEFDERPHRSRVVRVDTGLLAAWQRFLDQEGEPIERARLLFPVSILEAAAIAALADYPLRLGALSPEITDGCTEVSAKANGLIDYNRSSGDPDGSEYQPRAWREVILKGTQVSVATSIFKRHDANSNDPFGVDLVSLPASFVPDPAFVRIKDKTIDYLADQDRWFSEDALKRLQSSETAHRWAKRETSRAKKIPLEDVDAESANAVLIKWAHRRYTSFQRLAWRRQIAPDTERALYAALIPPGTAHVDTVYSLSMKNARATALVAGFWASLPLDYFLRVTGRSDLRGAGAKAMPAPHQDHPLASALLLRTLRLNCLTTAYADLWRELHDPTWSTQEPWALPWPGLQPLHDVTPEWHSDTPLRTERARRSALVEIDALVAVWLGMDADALIAAYRGRFPVLQKYEAVTWFDAEGWKLAGNARTIGQRQTKETWGQFQAYLADSDNAPVPDGYTAPFYKADREKEMREAHAYFQKRLDEAVARGEWDPVKQEVPAP